MIKKNLLFLFFATVSLFTQAANPAISGYITDASTGETLISATLFETKSAKGAVSNTYGFYSLSLPKGEIEVRFSYVGYRSQVIKILLNKDTTLNISMTPSTELKEIVVEGGSKRREFGVLGAQMGAIEVPVSQIKAIPALFGETDVLKALQLLPGVQGGAEGSAGLYVRGGGPDQNLLLLDGVPVYNVNHMGGFFSVFNADALKNVTLYKGNFPSRFSSRLSSVVDIRMNDGNTQKIHGNFSIGLITSKINLEGPLIKDKTTFNVSYRRTYGDLVIQPALWYAAKKDPDIKNMSAGYYFYDFNAKVSHKLGDKDKLFLSHYSGDDAIYVNTEDSYNDMNARITDKTKIDWKWGNMITALRWNHVVNSKLFMNTTASYTRYRFDMKIGQESVTHVTPKDQNEKLTLGYLSGISDYALRTEFDYALSPEHEIRFGAEGQTHTFRPGVAVAKFKSTDQNATQLDTTIGDKNVHATEFHLYAEDDLTLGRLFKANIGVNYSLFGVQGESYHSIEPRLSLRYLLADNLSVKAGYASMSQYIHLLSNSNLSLPTDLWVPVTKRIKPMDSRQYSAGLFYNLKNIVDLSLETYYKHMNNLIEYKDGAGFMGSSTGWEEKVNMGKGWSYGIEFLAQKSVGKTTGWFAYTWSKAERRFNRPGQEINFGKVFPAKYDRRHDISITLSHQYSEKFDFSGTWVFFTGNCGTLGLQKYETPVIPDVSWQKHTQVDYVSERNNYRLPNYHRLDLGFNFHKKKKHGVRTWNISFYNAYNQMNPFLVREKNKGTTYDPATGTTTSRKVLVKTTLFPIIPSISYSYKF